MRPHRLRLTAFGPFPGTVDVDLDEVSSAGPFLLRGATGAGKTSLLDAVGFALFGKVPGSRGLKQLRSHHAADGVRTSVELWATVSGRAVHVVRTPDQRRPRARGAGWTTDRATVSVRVARDLAALAADDCDLRLAGVQEANDELARLVGMTHEQFVQVVLLPQGDFARFLRAKDDDRADVLRALFDTSRFTGVEQHLRARRDATRDELAAAQAEVAAAAARVAAHVGQDGPDGDDVAGWAQAALEQARWSVEEAETQATAAEAALREVRARHEAASRRTGWALELVAQTRTRVGLLAAAATVADLTAELDAADRAAGVAALHEAHQASGARADAAVVRVGAALAGAHAPWDGDDAPWDGDDAPWDGDAAPERVDRAALLQVARRLDDEVVAAQQSVARLEALGRDVRRRDRLRDDLAATERALSAAELEASGCRAGADVLPARLDQELEGLRRLRPLADDLPDAERAVGRWQQALDRAATLEGLRRAADHAEADDLLARAARREADSRSDALRAARLAGMSAELAATLRPGQACAVCGSTEHPAPARAGHEPVVGADDEEQARLEAAARSAAADLTAVAWAAARTAVAAAHGELADRVAPELTVPAVTGFDPAAAEHLLTEIRDRRRDAAARLDRARAAAADLAAAQERLEALRVEQTEVAQQLADATGRVSGLTASRDAARQQLVDLDAGLAAGLQVDWDGDLAGPSFAEVWQEATEAAEARCATSREAAAAVAALVLALEDLSRTGQEAAAGSTEAGWDRLADAVAAARPRSWCEQARRTVAEHDRDLHTARTRCEELTGQLAAHPDGLPTDSLPTDGLWDVDVAPDAPRDPLPAAIALLGRAEVLEVALSEQVRVVDEAHRQARDSVSARRVVLQGLERTVPDLLRTLSRTGPLRREAEAARALADLVTGSNDKAIPLSTYVLAAHLEHVVGAANLRLHGMSDGRYALVHVEAGDDRRRRAGLGLAVLDAWTGVQRPAGTLSGGETFLASLALALGLADVVTAEAGGVRIDALFVDEGFGTLDPDSLDRAMDVLDQLQEHGRMVGVVSHVGELRQRLPRQVHVEGGRAGSTVRVLTG